MAPSRSERIVNLVIALLTTDRPLTREQVRQAVEGYWNHSEDAFRRTFERDKKDLRALGIDVVTSPVDTVFGDEIGYRIPRQGFELPPVQFSQAEADVLAMAAKVWRESVLDESANSALVKLRAAGVEPDTEAGPTTQLSAGVDDAAFAPLWRATIDATGVVFEYRGQRERHVDPWRMVLRRGRWYLLGRDRDVDEPRVFRLSRITSPVRTQGPVGAVVKPQADVIAEHLHRLEPPATQRVTARVRVEPGTRLGPLEMCAPEPGDSRPGDGSEDLVEVSAAGMDELLTAVVRAGGRARVEGPDQVRESMVARIAEIRGCRWYQLADLGRAGSDHCEAGGDQDASSPARETTVTGEGGLR